MQTSRCQIVEGNGQMAEDVDVLVIDQPLSEANVALDDERLTRGQVGMVAVGVGLPADVSLPARPFVAGTAAGVLAPLAEIVRLRRQREASRRQERVLTAFGAVRSADRPAQSPSVGPTDRRAIGQPWPDPWCIALARHRSFHEVNDRLGHLEGDAPLRRAATG